MTSVIIASLMSVPLTVATVAAEQAAPPHLVITTSQQEHQIDISQRFKQAKNGDAVAQLIVGMKYLELQNPAQALYWLRKSAAQGNVEAQIHLGDAYARGKGVSVDFVKAHMWLSLAAARGGYEAKFRFEYLLSKMTPEQIAEAQRANLARKSRVK